MADLVVFVPFSVGTGKGDIRENAEEIRERGGQLTDFDNVYIVYAGNSGKIVCELGDTIVVHAHGAKDSTALYDNLGGEVTMANVLKELRLLEAEKCACAYFAVCFGALKGHIAFEWNKSVSGKVFSTTEILQGALIKTTRHSVIASMFSGSDKRMTLL